MPSAQAAAEKLVNPLHQAVRAWQQGPAGQFGISEQRLGDVGFTPVHRHLCVREQISAQRKLAHECRVVLEGSRRGLGGFGGQRTERVEPGGVGGGLFGKSPLDFHQDIRVDECRLIFCFVEQDKTVITKHTQIKSQAVCPVNCLLCGPWHYGSKLSGCRRNDGPFAFDGAIHADETVQFQGSARVSSSGHSFDFRPFQSQLSVVVQTDQGHQFQFPPW